MLCGTAMLYLLRYISYSDVTLTLEIKWMHTPLRSLHRRVLTMHPVLCFVGIDRCMLIQCAPFLRLFAH